MADYPTRSFIESQPGCADFSEPHGFAGFLQAAHDGCTYATEGNCDGATGDPAIGC